MKIEEIERIRPSDLMDYAEIDPSFEIRSYLKADPIDGGIRGIFLEEKSIEPYVKNYDMIEGNNPMDWEGIIDLNKAILLFASNEGENIGGAILLFNWDEMEEDTATLWDIRIDSKYRRNGIGKELLERSMNKAKDKFCKLFFIETQNTNVPACKFYAANGFKVSRIDLLGYSEPEVRHEVKLVWYKEI